MTQPAGRYAPSPSGRLHVGNLRTALIAWAWARTTGRSFIVRNENLDPHRTGAAEQQIKELQDLGIDWDGPVINQTDRFPIYEQILTQLEENGQLFECYCSRKDISAASRAPHTPVGHYPGTCAHLTEAQRHRERERLASLGREPALRLHSPGTDWEILDMLHGPYRGRVDSFVLRRGDGTPAYNLAVVVDDSLAGVDQVVRGGDLLFAAPAQAYLAHVLGFPQPTYGHVPLVVGPTGKRLAKRDGAVTLEDLHAQGWSTAQILREMTGSLGVEPVSTAADLLDVFASELLPRQEFTFTAADGFQPQTVRTANPI